MTNYVTDNSGSLIMTTPVQMYNGHDKLRRVHELDFKSKMEFQEAVIDRILAHPTMLLLHPQWYV
jgi:hypothetical protein